MPQVTLDQVTQRPRMRTGRAEGAKSTKAPKPTTAAARPGLGRRRAGPGGAMARGFARRIATAMRTSMGLSWRAGKLVGRAQGTAALAPRVARGWWTGVATRMRLAGAQAQTRTLVRWIPFAFAGMRILARIQQGPQRVTTPMRRVVGARMPSRFAFLTGRSIGRVQGAVGTARLAPRAVKAARRAGFGWRPYGRPAPRGAMRATAWRLRRSWRWTRSFTLGFALGTIWAYLFAPRIGAGYQALRQGDQQTRSA